MWEILTPEPGRILFQHEPVFIAPVGLAGAILRPRRRQGRGSNALCSANTRRLLKWPAVFICRLRNPGSLLVCGLEGALPLGLAGAGRHDMRST